MLGNGGLKLGCIMSVSGRFLFFSVVMRKDFIYQTGLKPHIQSHKRETKTKMQTSLSGVFFYFSLKSMVAKMIHSGNIQHKETSKTKWCFTTSKNKASYSV